MLIGLTGRARAGKDTAAAALRGLGFTRVSFADPIRAMLEAMGMKRADMDGPRKEVVVPEFGFSYRKAAQTLGTEWGRGLNSDLWLDLAEARINEIARAGGHAVVTDVRFDNEARLIRDMGGKVLEVVRPDAVAVRAHASENPVTPSLVDAVLFNTSTATAFAANARYIVRCWMGLPVVGEQAPDVGVAHFAAAKTRIGPEDV